jgi:hypothetical protein
MGLSEDQRLFLSIPSADFCSELESFRLRFRTSAAADSFFCLLLPVFYHMV